MSATLVVRRACDEPKDTIIELLIEPRDITALCPRHVAHVGIIPGDNDSAPVNGWVSFPLPMACCQIMANAIPSLATPWSISASGVDFETEVCFLLTPVMGPRTYKANKH